MRCSAAVDLQSFDLAGTQHPKITFFGTAMPWPPGRCCCCLQWVHGGLSRASGGFSLQVQRAWTLADPATARARLVPWLQAKGRSLSLLSRMRLVQRCSTPAEHPLQNGSGRSVVVEL
jgi:hypothetical protein